MPLDSDHSLNEVCRVRAEISLDRIRSNFACISDHIRGTPLLPMVKANGYGHGAFEVARALIGEKDRLAGFGVATLEEGGSLRTAVPTRVPILVFSGCAPWTEAKSQYCKRFQLTPVLHSLADLKHFIDREDFRSLTYELKFDTGMNRLGIPADLAYEAASLLMPLEPGLRPQGVSTHLGIAENPRHPVSRRQFKRIEALHALFRPLEGVRSFHFANSAAIWNSKAWKVAEYSTLARPGLSLYGVPPWKGAKRDGLAPALRLRFQVLRRARLARSESLGYGATFTNRTARPLEIAVLGAGYGDGLLRSNAGRGEAYLGRKAYPFLGRISMDMSAIRCARGLKVGDWLDYLGDGIDPWRQAEKAGTVPYELLTSIGSRVLRSYDAL